MSKELVTLPCGVQVAVKRLRTVTGHHVVRIYTSDSSNGLIYIYKRWLHVVLLDEVVWQEVSIQVNEQELSLTNFDTFVELLQLAKVEAQMLEDEYPAGSKV